jgi:hypothetical protein
VLPIDLDLVEDRGRELKTRFSEIFQQADAPASAGHSPA